MSLFGRRSLWRVDLGRLRGCDLVGVVLAFDGTLGRNGNPNGFWLGHDVAGLIVVANRYGSLHWRERSSKVWLRGLEGGATRCWREMGHGTEEGIRAELGSSIDGSKTG